MYPLPVEVLPTACGLVTRALVALGGQPKYRQGFATNNGNIILDVHGLAITEPAALERDIKYIVGVVSNCVFAANRPERVFVASANGIRTR